MNTNLKEKVEQSSPLKKAAFALKQMQSKLDAIDSARAEPIAIIGMACRFPGAGDPDAYWQLLRNGVDAITEVPTERWDTDAFFDPDPEIPGKTYSRHGGFLPEIDRFEPQFFGISPREAVEMDPQQRLVLEVGWEALESAGQPPSRLIGEEVGVFIGISQIEYGALQLFTGDPANISAYTGTGGGYGAGFSAGRLSYTLGLQGPSLSLDTTCSSSLVTIHAACQSLRGGECELALAGGVNVNIHPSGWIFVSKAQALSLDGRCKTFDASADGFVRGEGCGIVVLKRLSDAIVHRDNILALIRGSAVRHNGVGSGFTVPNQLSQERIIRQALTNARVGPAEVSYIETHSTGSLLGDPIEVGALGTIFAEHHSQDSPLTIGSVKTNFGHLEAAAGIAGLMKVVLSLQYEEIPPHLHFKTPNPHIDWENLPFRVPVERQFWPRGGGSDRGGRIAGVSSFGMSGTHAHVVLEEAPATGPESPAAGGERPLHLLTLSARDETALGALTERYATYLEEHPDVPFPDVCFTANVGRTCFEHRLALVAESGEEARTRLRSADYISGRIGQGVPKTAFLFTGQGSQYVGMGQLLYETQPLFRKILDQCEEILRPLEVPLLDLLWNADLQIGMSNTKSSPLDQTIYTQPALFSLEYALARLWQSWGVVPNVVMGHGIGEYVAACVAGVFSLEDALKLVAARGRLMQTCPEGWMLAVSVSEEWALEIIAPFGDAVSVATINAPESVVISGEPVAIESVLAGLTGEAGIETKLLPIPRASHSPLMEPILSEFGQIADSITYSKPGIPLCSNVTGGMVTEEVTDPAYWVRHLREPVRFARSIETLHGQGFNTFLEIGPKPALLGMAGQCLPDDAQAIFIPTLRQGQDDWRQMLGSLGQWHIHGGTVDWAALDRTLDNEPPRRKVQLPTYPFQRQRYWIDKARLNRRAMQDPSAHPLLGQKLQLAGVDNIGFETKIDLPSVPWLTDHRVFDAAIFPATGYLEMALAAAFNILLPSSRQGMPGPSARNGNIQINNVTIEQALILPEEDAATIQLVLSPQDSGYRFEIFSRNEESGWIPHAAGELVAGEVDGDGPETVDLAGLRSQCPTEVPVTDHYQSCQERGLNYGPGFQGVTRIFRGKGMALGEIELPESLTDETGREKAHYRLHPALLDAALQVSLSAMPNAAAETYLPVGVKELRVHGSATGRLWALARFKGSDGDTAMVDVMLLDGTGITVAEVLDLTVGRVSDEVLRRHFKRQSDDLYEIAWRAQALEGDGDAATDGTPGSWLIFADRRGLGAKLAVQLDAAGNRCILVYADDSALRRMGSPCGRSHEDKRESISGSATLQSGFSDPNAQHISTGSHALSGSPYSDMHSHVERGNENSVWHIDPAEPTDFQCLFAEVSQAEMPPLQGILHLWALDAPEPSELTTEELTEAQTLTCDSVLHLLQTYVKQAQPAKLWLVTRNAVSVDQTEDSLSVAQAPLWGLGKVIAQEHPDFGCARVDLDQKADENSDTDALYREIQLDTGEDQIAFRSNNRYVTRLVRYRRTQGGLELPEGPYRLQILERGTLDNLELARAPRHPPQAGEVEIRVRASGLNFLDVVNALDLLPGKPDFPLGGECAGEIIAVGKDVEGFRVGDPVIAMALGSFGRYVTVHTDMVSRKPEGIGFEEAATIPVVFLTAYYCLHYLANLSAGDRVLIHAASGGVGQAAIQLAKLAGAEVFATASPSKWKFLKSLGIEHIMNSRTTDFAREIMEITEGEGVDVVLNSLTSEGFIEKSLSVLKNGGRFLEIGKVNIWQPGEVSEARPDVSYFIFDIARMKQWEGIATQPTLASIGSMLRELMTLFLMGKLKSLPHKAFPITDAINAFRHMQQARHIGKIILTPPVEAGEGEASTPPIRDDGTYLITGGLGALGLEVARWMAGEGARYLVLTGRREPSEAAQAVLRELEGAGVQVLVASADVSDYGPMADLFEKLKEQMPPLRGIIHAAGLLDDGVLVQQDMDRFRKVMTPKVAGSWNLHILTREKELDFFVCFSSMASLLGNAGQGNYAAANAFMDALVYHRRNLGLPGLSINWGAWAEIGLLAEMDRQQQNRLATMGMGTIDPKRGISILSELMGQTENTQVGVVPMNWPKFLKQSPIVPAFLSELAQGLLPTTESIPIKQRLEQANEEEYEGILVDFIRGRFANILRVDPTQLDIEQPLKTMGLDSLMAGEFRNGIRMELNIDIPLTSFMKDINVPELARQMEIQLMEIRAGTSPPSVGKEQVLARLESGQLSDEEIDALFDEYFEEAETSEATP